MAKAKKNTAVVDETTAVTPEVQEVEVIASDTFIAEDGSEYEFTVREFLFKGKKYEAADAVANAPDVLEELLKLNSFILKQK